ncbi:MAG: cytochrome c oxidase accessory protein CcoG [Planctomycetota bacterium]
MSQSPPPPTRERVLSTLHSDGSRRWIRPKPSPGPFLTRRRLVAWFLIVLFAALPYVRINGRPAVLLDIVHREFTIFGTTFHATDTFLLYFFAVSVVVGIFLITALFGRVWCGWACPQTVYMEFVFRPLERLIEGSRNRQLQLDRTGADWRRLLKYPVFLVVSMFVAHVFLSYFVGIEQLARWVRGSPTEHPIAFLVMAGVTAAMFFDFAYFREQTCLVACPYGRFQSVLLDQDSLIVGYDQTRGEPRGKGKSDGGAPRGDCVDCQMCVVTCPTGIDIRDGLQMECIGCTQCIDACDAVMARIGKPPGLIRYSSRKQAAGSARRLLRPRTVVYSAILLLGVVVALTQLSGRRSTEITVLRVHGSTFEILPSGEISNSVRVKIVNQSHETRSYTLEVADDSRIRWISATTTITLEPAKSETLAGFIAAPRELLPTGQREVRLRVVESTGDTHDISCRMLGPTP